MTDHFLLMTATPHKGDPENFCLFLELLDRDVYGDVKSLEEAMRETEAPFYLRRARKPWFRSPTRRPGRSRSSSPSATCRPPTFDLDGDEYDFYDALTRYVEDQSIKAAQEDSARGRALGFTMAMLQRRFASSIYAVRRSLERMRDKRKKILEDPEDYRRKQIEKLPDDFDDLPEEEQQEIIDELEDVVDQLRSGRAARGNPADRQADRPSPALGETRSRIQARRSSRTCSTNRASSKTRR